MSTPPAIYPPAQTAMRVHSLLGHQQMELALRCLGSLVQCHTKPLALVLHDDGTLTNEDLSRIHTRLRPTQIVTRQEADQQMNAWLVRHPRCLAMRRDSVLALKLFDVPWFAGETLVFCDADVLFLRRFHGLGAPSDAGGTDLVMMEDRQNAYALRPWHVPPFGGLPLPRKANSGLFFLRKRSYDLDFIEYVLTRHLRSNLWVKRLQWIEQTCWAALAVRIGGEFFDPRQVCVAGPELASRSSEELVAVHFVSDFRDMILGFAPGDDLPSVDAGVALRRVPLTHANSFEFLAQEGVKYFRRCLRW
jgi:hypothetical protein